MKTLVWHLIAGTRGGHSRGLILNLLLDRPYNTNQISEILDMDYKTVRHHLNVLMKNEIIVVEGDKYGAIYFPSKTLDLNEFNQIWEKTKKK